MLNKSLLYQLPKGNLYQKELTLCLSLREKKTEKLLYQMSNDPAYHLYKNSLDSTMLMMNDVDESMGARLNNLDSLFLVSITNKGTQWRFPFLP